jgi:Na+/citrate or Na+/malate symporter
MCTSMWAGQLPRTACGYSYANPTVTRSNHFAPLLSFLFLQVFFFISTALLFQCTGKSKPWYKGPAWTRHSTRALEEKSQKTAINWQHIGHPNLTMVYFPAIRTEITWEKSSSAKVVTSVCTVFRVSDGLHIDPNIMLIEFQPLEIVSRSLSPSFREAVYVLMR